jgi:hypothetical protein
LKPFSPMSASTLEDNRSPARHFTATSIEEMQLDDC